MPNIFITGSGRRIGKALAIEFAKKGWNVLIHYNRSKELAEETYEMVKSYNVKAGLVQADVRSYEELENAFNEGVETVGRPDVLVNNAGIFPLAMPIQDITEQFWDEAQEVNLRGQFYSAKLFSKLSSQNSRIVNIASLGGLEVWPRRIPYNVSKAGLIQLTKALSLELAPGIAVNAVCPGSIIIPGEAAAEDSPVIPEKRIPMRRHGNVMDIFDAVYFFATASMYITGQIISVDGGYHHAR
ncbi:MAG: SDR family NAD(P)-dependent oxidoreductase [Candidatus Kapaibacterium sp.]